MKLGSLCSGGGGLDMAVEAVFGAETVWHCETDKAASKVLAHHWPGVPNHGDLINTDCSSVEPVDIIAAGYPCQPFSAAGRRAGSSDGRHLWPHVATAVAELRPTLCVFENVSGHLSLGVSDVMADLDDLGYRVQWCISTASSVGAPHRRARLFMLAEDKYARRIHGWDYRRRGLHSTDDIAQRCRENVRRSDDGLQGSATAQETAGSVWRQHGASEAGRPGQQGCELLLAQERQGCDRVLASDATASGDKAGASRSGDMAVRGDSEIAARSRQGTPMVEDCEGTRCACAGSYVRTESDWARTENASRPSSICSDGRGPLGDDAVDSGSVAGRIHGHLAQNGLHHRRSSLRIAGAHATTDTSRGYAADASSNGRHEGRPESAGFVGGSDAAVSGDGPVDLLPTPDASSGGHGGRTRSAEALARGNRQANLAPDLLRWPPPPPSGLLGWPSADDIARLLPTPTSRDHKGHNQRGDDTCLAGALLPTPQARKDEKLLPGQAQDMAQSWGKYEPAILRWEQIAGPAPSPTEPNRNGNPRLNPAFSEWMMGWPAGWVTDVPGISRNDQLRIIGNGVVPQQAAAALQWLLSIEVVA